MANKTANYGLIKPLPEEFYDVSVQNTNMDIIDAELKKKFDSSKMPTLEDLGGAAAIHAAQHGKDGADPITIGMIGAAPSGYGLGELTGGVCDDCNTAVRNGWYNINTATQNCPVVDGIEHSVAALFVVGRTTRIWQTIYSSVSGAHVILSRYSLDRGSTWSEWVNADASKCIPLAGGTITGTIISNTNSQGFACAVNNYDVRLMTQLNGNRGLYDDKNGEWLLQKDANGAVTLNGTSKLAAALASGAVTVQLCGQWTGEIAKNGYTSKVEITPSARSGYTFLYPVAFGSNSSYFCCYGLYYTGGKIQLYGRNVKTDDKITPTIDVYGLYIKN